MGITQNDLCDKHMFQTSAHISGAKGSPDTVLNALEAKFQDYNDGIRLGYVPGPVDPQGERRVVEGG